MVARLDANSEAAEGEELELWLDIDRVHLFDGESGDRIAGKNAEPAGQAVDPDPETPSGERWRSFS